MSEWWFDALSAVKAIFRARTYSLHTVLIQSGDDDHGKSGDGVGVGGGEGGGGGGGEGGGGSGVEGGRGWGWR